MKRDRLLILQRLSFAIGFLLLAIWAGAWLHKTLGQRNDLEAFEQARQAVEDQQQADEKLVVAEVEPPPPRIRRVKPVVPLPDEAAPDYTLWSPKRVTDYEQSLEVDNRVPQALLRIPSLDLTVAVLDGVDDLTLNRAVGRIPGTSRPGKGSNLGLAGHRDGFFRGLKDIGAGDVIELITLTDNYVYEVDDITITTPSDVSVLKPTEQPTLTLVTCYPFYFVGHAPERYIVRAKLVQAEQRT